MSNPARTVALWDAINEYVEACGGDPSRHVYGNTRRMAAVVRVEAAVTATASPQPEPCRWSETATGDGTRVWFCSEHGANHLDPMPDVCRAARAETPQPDTELARLVEELDELRHLHLAELGLRGRAGAQQQAYIAKLTEYWPTLSAALRQAAAGHAGPCPRRERILNLEGIIASAWSELRRGQMAGKRAEDLTGAAVAIDASAHNAIQILGSDPEASKATRAACDQTDDLKKRLGEAEGLLRNRGGNVCPHAFCNECARDALAGYDFEKDPTK